MILKKEEIAKELRLSIPTINRLVAKGMPHLKIGKNIRFDTDEVFKWIKENYSR